MYLVTINVWLTALMIFSLITYQPIKYLLPFFCTRGGRETFRSFCRGIDIFILFTIFIFPEYSPRFAKPVLKGQLVLSSQCAIPQGDHLKQVWSWTENFDLPFRPLPLLPNQGWEGGKINIKAFCFRMAPFLILGEDSFAIPCHSFQECRKSEIGPQKASHASFEHFCQKSIAVFLRFKYFDY